MYLVYFSFNPITLDKEVNCLNGLQEKPLLGWMLFFYKPHPILFYHKIDAICIDLKEAMNAYINVKKGQTKEKVNIIL